MLRLKTILTEKDYITLMKEYILAQGTYIGVLSALWMMIIFVTGLTIWTRNFENIKILGFWWVLGISYGSMIPILISTRSKKIYQNTKLFHKEMTFEFTPTGLVWSTCDGTRTFPYRDLTILSRKHGLIVMGSVYHILPIPYTSISTEQFDKLITLPFAIKKIKLNSKQYYKNRVS
ncbi:MAG: hypothetical protein ACRCS8_02130 [Brevinema sp.]